MQDRTRRLPSKRNAEAEVLEWFRLLKVQVPPQDPVFLDCDNGLAETTEAAWLASQDGDGSDVMRIDPDQPDLEDLASAVVGITQECSRTYPSARHWSRSTLVRRLSSFLYASGITGSGGGCSSEGGDPVGGWIFHLPGWAALRHKRYYLLGKPRWWWECHRRQGLTLDRHQPAEPFVCGVCARCLPCPDCAAMYECEDTCPSLAPALAPPTGEELT